MRKNKLKIAQNRIGKYAGSFAFPALSPALANRARSSPAPSAKLGAAAARPAAERRPANSAEGTSGVPRQAGTAANAAVVKRR
jgi:hypothetical protein